MRRRWALVVLLAGTVIATCVASLGAADAEQDKYGGLAAIQGTATGWFHAEKIGGRHVLVTPDGHGLFALGINHIPPSESAAVGKQLRQWGFNMAGYNPPPESARGGLPYLVLLGAAQIAKHHPRFEFPDVFDPLWQERLEQQIASRCQRHRDDPYLIGYLWIDTPTWDIFTTRGLRGTDWVSEIRKLDSASPGKRRYASYLEQKYRHSAGTLAEDYGVQGSSLAELVEADFSRVPLGHPTVMEDDREFLGIIARQYYQFMSGTFRKHDRQHMVLGDIYLVGDHPREVLTAARECVDAIAIQPGDSYTPLCPPSDRFPEAEIDEIHRLTGKPILIADHQVAFPTPDQPRTIWTQRPTEADAARAAEAFIGEAFSKPYIVGYIRCQYRDASAGPRGSRRGLLRQDGSPYQEMAAAHQRANRKIVDQLARGLRQESQQ